MKINSNINATVAANSLSRNQRVMDDAMERLSTGVRINSAADDAAGLSITSKMTSQINGLKQAVRNANDAISMVQTASSATQDVVDMLQRLRELAVQAANGSNTAADKAALQQEANQIIAGIDKIATQTQWNGVNLLDGTMAGKFQVGAHIGQIIDFDFESINPVNLGSVNGQSTWIQIGSDINGNRTSRQFGFDVALAASQNTFVVSSRGLLDENRMGFVQIYDWNGSGWEQRGADIRGIQELDQYHKVSISDDGDTVSVTGSTAVSGSEGSEDIFGNVRIFDWSGTSWIQRGSTIPMRGYHEERSGVAELSSDGNTIIFSPYYNTNIADPPMSHEPAAYVYDWNGVDWVQRGGKIPKVSSTGDKPISISKDTNTIVVGSHIERANQASDNGSVKVFEWNGSDWVQKGSPIEGSRPQDFEGVNTSISDDGNTIAIGAPSFKTGHSTAATSIVGSGIIEIYDWDGIDWKKRGETMHGYGAVSTAGSTRESSLRGPPGLNISISNDGNTVVGSGLDDPNRDPNRPNYPNDVAQGYVQVYEWNGSSWIEKGEAFVGHNAYSLAKETDLGHNGGSLIIGASGNDDNGLYSGAVRVFGDVSHFPFLSMSYASTALNVIDQAIEKLSSAMAGYGALHNRLECAVDNLTNIAQNTEAARSRILDTDYAKETTELARTQIIQQAAMAMLTQANQQTEQILELLKSVD